MDILDSYGMKQCDKYTIEKIGIPSLVLMERAALSVVEEIEKEFSVENRRVLVVSGTGNNGGDGIAVGRLLALKGARVDFCVVGSPEKYSQEMKQQVSIAVNLGFQVENIHISMEKEYDIIIDALFGIGLSKDIEGEFARAIEHINHFGKHGKVYAVDIPSGIQADTGEVLKTAVRAYKTVTFQYLKAGLCLYPGNQYTGEVCVKDIGISDLPLQNGEIFRKLLSYEKDDLKYLPKRDNNGNKGTFGRVLVIAGTKNMAGAAYFAADAAYTTGCGLVEVFTSEANRIILQQKLPEAVLTTYEEGNFETNVQEKLKASLKRAKAIVLGPGLEYTKLSAEMVEFVMKNAEVPCVVDAGALNILSEHKEWFLEKKMPCIITPHLKELSRLCEQEIQLLKKEYGAVALSFAKEYDCVVVAKEGRTIVADKEKGLYLNLSGCNGMATGGSGDVLTGIIASLLAQGDTCYEMVCLGVYLHGLAGEAASEQYGNYSMKAGNIIESIHKILN